MRKWGVLFTIAMGFILGLVLAGIGGISAGLQASSATEKIQINKIDEYWDRTDLDIKEIKKLVNDQTCALSEKYFLACVNSVISALAVTNERLTYGGEIIPVTNGSMTSDNFTEKQNLVPFIKAYQDKLYRNFSFEKIWNHIFDVNKDKFPEKYLSALGINGFLSLTKDPHTYIMPIEYFENVTSSVDRSPYFVGITFEKKFGKIYIKRIFKNSDADNAGLQIGDELLTLNGRKSESLSLPEISLILKNRDVRNFTLVLKREGSFLVKNFQRTYRVLSQVYSEVLSGKKNIGIVQVSKFSKNVCAEVQDQIQKMSDKNISGLILDLRDNPGGHLSEAACLAGLFIGSDKKIYSVQYFDLTKSNEVVLTSSSKIYSGPLVVLTNSSSASASELLAGALQEYHRAVIVGHKTFGKGTFQEVENWKDYEKVGYFKTKGFYLLPSGRSTQFYGVHPDLEIPNQSDELLSSEENNYMNPIRPILNTSQNLSNTELPLNNCDSAESVLDPDIYNREAIKVLYCSEVMSLIANQFSSQEL